MITTPNSLRLQLALTGRSNCGKSTLLNLISGQDTAITSPQKGTTTDVVSKAMELRPLGAVLLLDTAGIDDDTALGDLRAAKSFQTLDRADVLIIVTTPGVWGEPEMQLVAEAGKRKVPVLTVINKCDTALVTPEFAAAVAGSTGSEVLQTVAADREKREEFLNAFTAALLKLLPESLLPQPPLLRDLAAPGSLVVLMTPIDLQAPRGRLILPQIQAIRDALDGDCCCIIAKEDAFPAIYGRLKEAPALVVCDSQVVDLMIARTPENIPCTTFSILMARLKGDLEQFIQGVRAIETLQDGDRILIAESCTHHAADDDIGRVKIPALLRKKSGKELHFEVFSGSDFPAGLSDYKLVLHCGGCMLNRRAMLNRLQQIAAAGVPVVNYGMCISHCKGVLPRVLSPFQETRAKLLEKM